MEEPKLDTVLALAREQGLDLNPETTIFNIGRESLAVAENSAMARWGAFSYLCPATLPMPLRFSIFPGPGDRGRCSDGDLI